MIEIKDYRIRWDGSFNYVVEKKALDKDGQYKFKDGEQVYNNPGYHGRHLLGAIKSMYNRLLSDSYNEADDVLKLMLSVEDEFANIDGGFEKCVARLIDEANRES